jgi:hypothetical protein
VVLPSGDEVCPPLPCTGKWVDGWSWEVDPSKVELSKEDPNTVALTGV